jgi:hypothetical protein
MIQQLTLFNIEEYTMEIENPINITQQEVKQIIAIPEDTQIELELFPSQLLQLAYYRPEQLLA